MRINSLHVVGLLVLAGAALHGQAYYSITPLDCTGVGGPVSIVNSSGVTVGFSCFVSGTFTWFAAGGPANTAWSTAIRVAAPESAPIGVDFTFYDKVGAKLSLDTTYGSGSAVTSANELQFALNTNQPVEVDLLGATTNAPSYNSIAEGTVFAVFYCPDGETCSNVPPQLLYSQLPNVPWFLSAPIVWDDAPITTQWSAEGVDDGDQRRVSFVVYNKGIQSADFDIRVYDSKGNLSSSGTTKSIPNVPLLPGGFYGEGGTYADLVTNVTKKPFPAGLCKIVIDGGPSIPSAVQMLQFNVNAAAAMQVSGDSQTPGVATSTPGQWNTRVAFMAAPLFPPLP